MPGLYLVARHAHIDAPIAVRPDTHVLLEAPEMTGVATRRARYGNGREAGR